MRIIASLFIIAAIGLGLFWPWAQLNFLGTQVAEVEFGGLSGPVPERQSFNLTADDNPVRIRFRAKYIVDAKLPPQKIPVRVVITDRDGTLLSGIVSFTTDGIQSGPEQPTTRASQPVEFNVINAGEHELYLELAPNNNDGGILRPGIASITATVIANAPAVRDDFKALAAVLALAGFYLFVRSRRRGSQKKDMKNKPRRWGRGE